MTDDLLTIAGQFQMPAPPTAADPLGAGLIHDTYLVYADSAPVAVLQRVNTGIFPDVETVQQNIQRVTSHLREKILSAGGDPAREALTVVPAGGGASFVRDAAGECWRMSLYINGARTVAAATPTVAYEAARAFGRFQQQLADLSPDTIGETIPDFHNTPMRFDALAAAADADVAGRASRVAREIDLAMRRRDRAGELAALIAAGDVPIRICHNDTKIDNVLLDDVTGRGLCVIDLDTVMPGASIVDFGDCCRVAAATSAEDEPDLSKVAVDETMFAHVARGYLETAGGLLTEVEIEHLPFAAWLVALEQGVRFLGDYLAGDVYYKTTRPGQNLDRARTQLTLVEDYERLADRLSQAVRECRRESS